MPSLKTGRILSWKSLHGFRNTSRNPCLWTQFTVPSTIQVKGLWRLKWMCMYCRNKCNLFKNYFWDFLGQIKISFSHEKSPQACYVYCQCDESAHCMLSVKFPFLESPWKLESPKQILNTPKVLFFQGGNSFTSTDLISKSRDCSWSCTQHRSVLGETFFPVWGFSLYCTAQLCERLPGYQI